MTDAEQVEDPKIDQFLVMGAYGETMLRFQLLEMSYWSILAARLKRGATLDQGMTKLAGWESQTGGRLIKALGLPGELKDEADMAVNTRNYLAHEFLRDRAPFMHDAAFCHHVAEELAAVHAKLDAFEQRLDTYMRGLGIITELPEEELEKLEKLGLAPPLDPATWFRPRAGEE